jgi:hypothetical protein
MSESSVSYQESACVMMHRLLWVTHPMSDREDKESMSRKVTTRLGPKASR